MQIGSGYSRAVKDRGDVTVRDGRPPQVTHWMGGGGGREGWMSVHVFAKR